MTTVSFIPRSAPTDRTYTPEQAAELYLIRHLARAAVPLGESLPCCDFYHPTMGTEAHHRGLVHVAWLTNTPIYLLRNAVYRELDRRLATAARSAGYKPRTP